MRIWCLTSLIIREFNDESSKISQRQYDFAVEKLKGCEKYALTELFIGKHDVNVEFHVFREDTGVLRWYLGRELKPTRISKDVADIEVLKNSNIIGDHRIISKIRVRCIKNISDRKFTKQQKEYYQKYATQIEKYAADHPELGREAAFVGRAIPTFKLPDEKQSDKKQREDRRMIDLIGAFGSGNDTRYDQPIDKNIAIRYHQENDARISLIKSFAKTKEIRLHRAKVTKIPKEWFEARSLEVLEITDCSPFEVEDSWKVFIDGIKNCQKLTTMQLNNLQIDKIPDYFMDAIPESLLHFALSNNRISKISPKISRLVNLVSLSLEGNSEISDDGFPWTELPETLVMLGLAGTKITKIPEKIARLTNLKRLQCGDHLKYVEWMSLPDELQEVSFKCGGKINFPPPMILLTEKIAFELINCRLDRRFYEQLSHLYGHVNLSNNNFPKFRIPAYSEIKKLYLNDCKIKNFALSLYCSKLVKIVLQNNFITQMPQLYFPDSDFTTLTYLDLKKNKITKIEAEFLPPSLVYLDLSFNQITTFESIENLENLLNLNISNNIKLKQLPEGIEKCHIYFFNASKTGISSLPENFENLPEMKLLDLSENEFSGSNLAFNLWDRLPQKIETLILDKNTLGELPCQLSHREIRKIEANDCHLRHICPRIASIPFEEREHSFVCVKNNGDLKKLSFVPSTIYSPPITKGTTKSSALIAEHVTMEKGRIILVTNHNFRDTSRWNTIYKIHTYDFLPKPELINFPISCHCCARCGTDCSENSNGRIETFMVMDFTLVFHPKEAEEAAMSELEVLLKQCFITEENEDGTKDYGPGKWKTLINTKMCSECIQKMKDEIINFYNDSPLKRKNAKKVQEQPPVEPHQENMIVENDSLVVTQNVVDQPENDLHSSQAAAHEAPQFNNELPLAQYDDVEMIPEYNIPTTIQYATPQQNYEIPYHPQIEYYPVVYEGHGMNNNFYGHPMPIHTDHYDAAPTTSQNDQYFNVGANFIFENANSNFIGNPNLGSLDSFYPNNNEVQAFPPIQQILPARNNDNDNDVMGYLQSL